jgi:hypothetical protein
MDILNRVTTVVRHDTSQAEQAVKRLRGAERDRAKVLLDDLNAGNAKLDSQIATWTKVGVAVGGIVVAYKGAQIAAHAYLEDVRLESAAAGVNIDRLREATKGLVETDNLLAFAGKAQHGVWRLNQDEMELVMKGANALRIQMGTELQPTVDKLTEAVAKGSTRALKEFGIEASSKSEALAALEARIKSLRGETSLTGDDFERAGVKWKDAVDDLTGALGRLAIGLGPVISKLAEMVGVLAKAAKGTVDFLVEQRRLTDEWWAARGIGQKEWFASHQTQIGPTIDDELERGPGAPTPETEEQRLARLRITSVEQRIAQLQATRGPSPWTPVEVNPPVPKGIEWKEPKPEELRGKVAPVGEFIADTAAALVTAAQSLASAAVQKAGPGDVQVGGQTLTGMSQWKTMEFSAESTGGLTDKDKQNLAEIEEASKGWQDAVKEAQAASAEFAHQNQGKFLETIFGPVSQFNVYAKGFDMLTGAASAAFDAWITGSQSMGAAIKHFIGEALRATALQMMVEALKETAYGVASLVWGPIGAIPAAGHFKAAAAFGAAAIAAGATAKALGAGAGTSTATPTAAGAGQGSSTGGARSAGAGAGSALAGGSSRMGAGDDTPQGTQVVIMLGRDFLGFTDLEQRDLISRAIQMGTKTGTRTSNIRHS